MRKKIVVTLIAAAVTAAFAWSCFVYGGAPAPQTAAEPKTPQTGGDGAVTVLLMGTDAGDRRTDTIMLVSLLPDENRIELVSIPRDTRVTYGGRAVKINSVYARGGAEAAVAAAEEVADVRIDHYVKVGIGSFEEIVDALGGVYFEVPCNMNYDDPAQDLHIHLDKGLQLLNGADAVAMCRFREYVEGDVKRTEVQRDFIAEFAKQKLRPEYITKLPQIISALIDKAETDVGFAQALRFLPLVKTLQGAQFESSAIKGYAKTIGGVSYYIAE